MSYVIYSDESGSGVDRFEAVGTISGLNTDIALLRTQLKGILVKYSQSHCEYKKVSGGLIKQCAQEFIQELHKFVVSGRIKIMVLVWDKYDERHQVSHRDDCANLSIMYYHALKTTMKQWSDTTIDTSFHPDELSKVDFSSIVRYVNNTRVRDYKGTATLLGSSFRQMFSTVVNHSETISRDEPITQLIDIMTGIVRLSYEESDRYKEWLLSASGQQDLFSPAKPATVSKNMSYKFELKSYTNSLFKANAMQVALDSTNGFHSHRPSCGYFFWKYHPQRVDDKAPTKIYG